MPKIEEPVTLLVSDNVWVRHSDAIRAISPGLTPIIYEGNDVLPDELISTINTVFYSSDLWPERSRGFVLSVLKATSLKWMHTFSAGVDSPFFVQLMERGIRLTNSTGATASPIGQTTVLYMLALSRNVRAWFQHQEKHEWSRHEFAELDGARLAVIGMGPIGIEIARLGVALNMNVEAIRRTPTGSEPCPTFSFDQLLSVLARADWVAVALPLTDDTSQIFNAETFAIMKPGAHFINVGRGELVNEDSLIATLQSGHLAGAALDVFATEPLPPDSPLWDMDNVIITPHSSAASAQSGLRSEDIFLRNLARYVAGEPMLNEVNL
ncbi:MAG: D-2-hydroxyacid dehydrogenase [Ilumatobacteraceae bacterium]|nr:D-2-hydroxyacid dehydrogenase [Ilumatobacteraceae bacterium]